LITPLQELRLKVQRRGAWDGVVQRLRII